MYGTDSGFTVASMVIIGITWSQATILGFGIVKSSLSIIVSIAFPQQKHIFCEFLKFFKQSSPIVGDILYSWSSSLNNDTKSPNILLA